MRIKPIRPADESRTICSLKASDRVQHIVIAAGALTFGAWVLLPSAWQNAIKSRAIPVASAMMAGAGFTAKWYNSKAKDGRLDVGDLFTMDDDGRADPGDFAKSVLMNRSEFEAFEAWRLAPSVKDAALQTARSKQFSNGGIVGVVARDNARFKAGAAEIQPEDLDAVITPPIEENNQGFSIKL